MKNAIFIDNAKYDYVYSEKYKEYVNANFQTKGEYTFDEFLYNCSTKIEEPIPDCWNNSQFHYGGNCTDDFATFSFFDKPTMFERYNNRKQITRLIVGYNCIFDRSNLFFIKVINKETQKVVFLFNPSYTCSTPVVTLIKRLVKTLGYNYKKDVIFENPESLFLVNPNTIEFIEILPEHCEKIGKEILERHKSNIKSVPKIETVVTIEEPTPIFESVVETINPEPMVYITDDDYPF